MRKSEFSPAVTKAYCLGIENPLGITQTPEFSFETDRDFSAVRIQCECASGEIIWDKLIQTQKCFGITYGGRPLQDRERITYRIGCYAGEAFGGFSEDRYFETGISPENCTAQWVFDPDFSGASPVFLQCFSARGEVASARLYVTGLGYFDAFCNGINVDGSYFKPVVTVYDDRPLNDIIPYFFNDPEKLIYYHTYDITDLLKQTNLLAVSVGGGWYYNVEKEMEGNYSYGTPRAIFEIIITYKDGTIEKIASGANTRRAPCHIRKSTLFKGEVQDFRFKKPEDYTAAEADSLPYAAVADRPPSGLLQGNIWPNDCVKEVLKPISEHVRGNRKIVDFGRNHAGVVRIRAKGESGARMVIKSAENLDENGELDHLSTGWNYLIETDECIFSGHEEIFSPRYTFHGYRYIEIVCEGEIDIFEIESLVITSNVKQSGYFQCSVPILNAIDKMYVHTQESNLHGCIPSDCPHREKRGFTGDGQVTCASAICSFDMRSFYKKWMRDIAGCQDPATGSVPHTAPYSGGGCSPGFGSAIAILPMEYYKYYSDDSLLKKYLPNILLWIDYLDHQHNGDYIIVKEEREWSLGEWFCPEKIEIPREYVKTYFFSKCCAIALEAMRIVRDYTAFARIEKLRREINASIKQKFFDGLNFCGAKNAANIFALDIGVLQGEEREKTIKATIKHYRSARMIDTGIFATRMLFAFLTENGCEDLAFELITSQEHPSYGYMLANGATTLWECWEKTHTPDFWYSSENFMKGYPASHNHPMLGSVVAWMYEAIGGLDFSGFGDTRTIIFQPKLQSFVGECRAEQQTAYGKASLHYIYKNGAYKKFDVQLPPNTYGIAIMDAESGKKTITLQSGKYSLV